MRIDAAERRTPSDEARTMMRLVRGLRAIALAGVIGGIAIIAVSSEATPRVVADEACPYYAVDIEAFATCEEDGVAGPRPSDTAEVAHAAAVESAPRREAATPAEHGDLAEPAPRSDSRTAADS